ncbi:GNAT family N-acetyltransferase [Nonomuraea sp. N2-4H]|uniref:GNAT family N-acetyltransferase n=1 Tax=Nonomuraea sp. N2-4H TaxID=3128898 RepID=UPI0032457DC7
MEHEEAAARAGVVVRELCEIGEFEQVYRLFDEIWRPGPTNVPATVELMVEFAHTGNYVAGAYAGDELVGASVGFRAAGRALHSHVTGAVVGRGIGYALKAHQKWWCLERGLERITWTFDPLVRRNAYFNLVKLGARPEEYLPDFYGVMADAINEGDESDRLMAVWHLDEDTGADHDPREAAVRLWEGPNGEPVLEPDISPQPALEPGISPQSRTLLVGTPSDIERLRRDNAYAARAWRRAMREALGGAMAAGGLVVGFTTRGEYVVSIT